MEIGSKTAPQLYQAALDAAQPAPLSPALGGDAEGGATAFGETLVAAARETVDTIAAGEAQSQAFMAGKADPHSVVEALAQTEMALEMAVAVRDQVVAAYQEILRMPI